MVDLTVSLKGLKNKKATINPKNKDNKSFHHPGTYLTIPGRILKSKSMPAIFQKKGKKMFKKGKKEQNILKL